MFFILYGILQKKYLRKNSMMKKIVLVFSLFFSLCIYAQSTDQSLNSSKQVNPFWDRVQYGGTLALNFGNDFTNITVAPQAIYHVNEYFAFGPGLQYSYMKSRNFFESRFYGGSLLGLFTPTPEFQISAEFEQLRVNNKIFSLNTVDRSNFWNSALFLGLGYRTNNVVVGIRYNVLHNSNDLVYTESWMPFVRVFF